MNSKLNWEDVKAVLAVIEHGTLSGAALSLQVSQPTLGRHISSIEDVLGQALFVRGRLGAVPTDFALQLMPAMTAMEEASKNLSLLAGQGAKDIKGPVRITASEIVATYVLPQFVGRILDDFPDVEFEIVATNSNSNLLQREADIAVRVAEPDQLDLISKKLGNIRLGLFAHQTYLNRSAPIGSFEDLQNHVIMGYDKSDLMLKALRNLGIPAERSMFRLRADDQALHVEYLRQGAGIVATQTKIALAMEGVSQVLPEFEIPSLPVYLLTHRQLRNAAPVRAVYDALSGYMSTYLK